MYVAASLYEQGKRNWAGRRGRVKLLDVQDGSTLPGLTRDFGAPVRVIAAGDFDDNGEAQILVLHEIPEERRCRLRLLRIQPGLPDGPVFDTGPVFPDVVGVADLNGDGRMEVLVATGNELRILDHQLRPLLSWRRPYGAREPIWQALAADLGGARRIIVASGQSRATFRVDVLEVTLPE